MSMSHRAYLFDWRSFRDELAPLLEASLADHDVARLIAFANAHLSSLSDPYEGDPVTDDWMPCLENGDEQEIADYLLTKYYDPSADLGLGHAWLQLESSLPEEARAALLGRPFGPEQNLFDPGRMGAYFQDEEMTRTSLTLLRSQNHQALDAYIAFLEHAVFLGKGLYVTF